MAASARRSVDGCILGGGWTGECGKWGCERLDAVFGWGSGSVLSPEANALLIE